MTDPIDRAERDRERRNAATVAELSAVCRLFKASAFYVPLSGIFVIVSHLGVKVEWHWSHTARAASVKVRGEGDSTHPAVAPGVMALTLTRTAVLLDSEEFNAALAITLTRTHADSARALAEYRAQLAAAEESHVSEHGG